MELFTGASNIAGGNPPVPALLGLLLVTLLLRKPLHLTESELIAFYIFSVMSIIPAMSGGVRAFFPALTVPGYFAQQTYPLILRHRIGALFNCWNVMGRMFAPLVERLVAVSLSHRV